MIDPAVKAHFGLGPRSGEAKGYAVADNATTQDVLADLPGFESANAAQRIGIVSDAACYVAFGDAAVTVDTANDAFVPANTPLTLRASGRFFGMQSLSGTANVRIWPQSHP